MSIFSPFSRWLTRIRNPHHPLITVVLSRSALLNNLHEFQKLSPAVAPVLKSNAYGHGLLEVASILQHENVPFLIIDSFIEARNLRAAGITLPLLIIGYTPVETIASSKLKNISFTVTSYDALRAYCSKIDRPTKIHLKIDTGMCRQGTTPAQLSDAIELLRQHPQLKLEGICSHFSDADNLDPSFTNEQIARWNESVELFKKHFPNLKYFHTSNTAGHGYVKEAQSNMTRLGFGLYGFSGNGVVDAHVHLKPVMEVTAHVSGIKTIEKGSKVGYNGTFVASREMRLATIPMGYYEGIDRRLSNKGSVKIGTSFAPIAGRVSMNITTIDITDIPDVELDSSVVVISRVEKDPNSFVTIAKLIDTTPYELIVSISPFLQKVVVE